MIVAPLVLIALVLLFPRLTLAAAIPLVFGTMAVMSSAEAQNDDGASAEGQSLISLYYDLDGMCRGWSGDSPHTNEACAAREKAFQALSEAGYCMVTDNSTSIRWARCQVSPLIFAVAICAKSGTLCHLWDIGGNIITYSTLEACQARISQTFYNMPAAFAECRSRQRLPGERALDD